MKTRQKAVAEKINQELPELAFLRQHAPPDEEEAENLEGWMKSLNMNASFKSSKAVAQSLKNLFEKTQSVEGKGDFSKEIIFLGLHGSYVLVIQECE